MGANDVTAEMPAVGDGEVAEGEGPAVDVPGDGGAGSGSRSVAKKAAARRGARAKAQGADGSGGKAKGPAGKDSKKKAKAKAKAGGAAATSGAGSTAGGAGAGDTTGMPVGSNGSVAPAHNAHRAGADLGHTTELPALGDAGSVDGAGAATRPLPAGEPATEGGRRERRTASDARAPGEAGRAERGRNGRQAKADAWANGEAGPAERNRGARPAKVAAGEPGRAERRVRARRAKADAKATSGAGAERGAEARQARAVEREHRRAARTAAGGLRERRRAAREATTLRRTPAGRRAMLVASAASITAAAEEPVAEPAPPRRLGRIVPRAVALVAVLLIPGYVWALLSTQARPSEVSTADATFIGAQIIQADQRVRVQLARLQPLQVADAKARTRDALATTNSLARELERNGGAEAERLQRALRLERSWLDAVGSTLTNPRSPLRDELVARDAALRPALDALPGPAGRRAGGARHLVDYAKSRSAKRSG